MRKWTAIYYEDEKGYCQISEFLDSLPSSARAKVLAWISALEEQGSTLPRPYADLLEDGIHELRIKVKGDQERILYFFVFQDYIILTHQFEKHTQKVDKAEIKKAKSIRNNFERRFKTKKDFEASLTD